MKAKASKGLGFLAGMGLAIWLWQRERTDGDIGRRLKYALIRGTQSARLVRGREHAPWVRRFYYDVFRLATARKG